MCWSEARKSAISLATGSELAVADSVAGKRRGPTAIFSPRVYLSGIWLISFEEFAIFTRADDRYSVLPFRSGMALSVLQRRVTSWHEASGSLLLWSWQEFSPSESWDELSVFLNEGGLSRRWKCNHSRKIDRWRADRLCNKMKEAFHEVFKSGLFHQADYYYVKKWLISCSLPSLILHSFRSRIPSLFPSLLLSRSLPLAPSALPSHSLAFSRPHISIVT